ncbi:unnamed protein product [Mesocestoides corti]|uniref:Uncharacterized protein n=2 Tax=Mesocestoides corti TaxID=53468 RepID=A0A0R3U6Q0_MESCO|nr:unnamed protein product [Mesocestoides corti]
MSPISDLFNLTYPESSPVNRSSVDEMATHILSKRIAPTAEGNSTAGQACVARIASEGVFILEPGDSGVVLSHFKLPQVVHCADMSSIQPG